MESDMLVMAMEDNKDDTTNTVTIVMIAMMTTNIMPYARLSNNHKIVLFIYVYQRISREARAPASARVGNAEIETHGRRDRLLPTAAACATRENLATHAITARNCSHKSAPPTGNTHTQRAKTLATRRETPCAARKQHLATASAQMAPPPLPQARGLLHNNCA